VRQFSQHSYNVTVNSHNGQLTLHTGSYASEGGVVRRVGSRILRAKFKLLNSEIALSRKPFEMEHMYIYTFLFRMTDTMTSQNIDLSSWDTLYSCRENFKSYRPTLPIRLNNLKEYIYIILPFSLKHERI
jgi:hypothetical protein